MRLFYLLIFILGYGTINAQEDCGDQKRIETFTKVLSFDTLNVKSYVRKIEELDDGDFLVAFTRVEKLKETDDAFLSFGITHLRSAFLARLDANLDIKWIKKYDSSFWRLMHREIFDFQIIGDNVYMSLACTYHQSCLHSNIAYLGILIKIDLDGNVLDATIWDKGHCDGDKFQYFHLNHYLEINPLDTSIIVNFTGLGVNMARFDKNLNLLWHRGGVHGNKVSKPFIRDGKILQFINGPRWFAYSDGQVIHLTRGILDVDYDNRVYSQYINIAAEFDMDNGELLSTHYFGFADLKGYGEEDYLEIEFMEARTVVELDKGGYILPISIGVPSREDSSHLDNKWKRFPGIYVLNKDFEIEQAYIYNVEGSNGENRFITNGIYKRGAYYFLKLASDYNPIPQANPYYHGDNKPNMNNYVLQLNEDFEVVGSQGYGGEKCESFFAMTPTKDGGWVIGGDTEGWLKGDTIEGTYFQKTDERTFSGFHNHHLLNHIERLEFDTLLYHNDDGIIVDGDTLIFSPYDTVHLWDKWRKCTEEIDVYDYTDDFSMSAVYEYVDTLPDLIPRQYKILSHCENEYEIELAVCNIGEHFANYPLPLYFGNNPTDTAWIKPLLDYYECDTLRFTVTSDSDSLDLYIGMSPEQYAQHLLDGFRPWMAMSECDYANNKTTIALPPSAQNIDTIICAGSGFYVNGEQVENTGIFYENNTNQYGCDSLVIWSVYVEDLLDEVSLHINPYHDGEKGSISVETNYSGLEIGLSPNSIQSDLLIEDLNPGSYTLFVQSPNSCLIKIPFVIENTTGLRDIAKENWSFYPNPAHDVIHFTKRGDYRVYDVNDRLILSCEKKVKLDLSTLVGGVYFVEGFGKWKKLVVGN